MLGALADQPVADNRVPVVEDGRLAGRDAVARRGEPEAEAVGRRLDAGSDGVRPIPQLNVGVLDRQVEASCQVDRRARQRAARADDDGIRAGVRAQGVERLRGCDAESLSLSGREAPVPRVAAELVAVLVDDCTLCGSETAALEERAVVVPGEEARLLALAARRAREACTLRLGASLGLGLLAEREHDPVELPGIELPEHVGLILLRVDRAREQTAAVALDDACVVPGCKPVGACATLERE